METLLALAFSLLVIVTCIGLIGFLFTIHWSLGIIAILVLLSLIFK